MQTAGCSGGSDVRFDTVDKRVAVAEGFKRASAEIGIGSWVILPVDEYGILIYMGQVEPLIGNDDYRRTSIETFDPPCHVPVWVRYVYPNDRC